MNERDRIEMLMRCYELTPSQFADRTGIQRASVSHILSGRNKPSLEVMLKIYDSFPGVDLKWLMTGVGEEPSARQMSIATPQVQENLSSGVVSATVQQSRGVEDTLFAVSDFAPNDVAVQRPAPKPQQPAIVKTSAERQYKRASAPRAAAAPQVLPARKIKEIRVYYTDGTYEIMYPEK